jgi:hypothetical protein
MMDADFTADDAERLVEAFHKGEDEEAQQKLKMILARLKKRAELGQRSETVDHKTLGRYAEPVKAQLEKRGFRVEYFDDRDGGIFNITF